MKKTTKPFTPPLAYFITFTCYGTWLHGSEKKSVTRKINNINYPYLAPSPRREILSKNRMKEPSFILDRLKRQIVLRAIKNVCHYQQWELYAAHVRTNHVHLVIGNTVEKPEKVMNTIKAYASRALNAATSEKRSKYWTRHGSTRYLWKYENIVMAMRYIIFEQGEPMALFYDSVYPLELDEG